MLGKEIRFDNQGKAHCIESWCNEHSSCNSKSMLKRLVQETVDKLDKGGCIHPAGLKEKEVNHV